MPTLHIRPARVEDIHRILLLHKEAFADKFGGAFGANGAARGMVALAVAWQHQGLQALQGMFVAEWQQRVVGTITLRTWEMADNDPGATERAFQQVLGLWGATRSIFALSLLSHRVSRHEGFITDVAVLANFRRQGIGSALLTRIEDEGRLRHRHYLGLYVSSSNTAAINLYRNAGFYRSHTRRSWLTRLFFGQREWIYMRKDLL